MNKAALAALGALLLLVPACGGGAATPSSTTDGKKEVRALTAALTDPAQGVATGDARCIATRFVDALDVQPLVDARVVTKSFAYVDGAVTSLTGKVRTAYDQARASCLEDKIADSMVAVIATPGGLITRSDARCVARTFTSEAGYDRLVAGQAVTTQLTYVSNGAVQTPQNAAAYAKALEKCVGEKKVSSAMSTAVRKAFASGAGGPATANVSCVISDFVKKVGVKGLLSNRLVTDTGVFNTGGAAYDADSAGALADSILGCVDALKSQAEAAASTDPSLDAAALETCLKKAISPAFLRDDFLVNQLLGKDAQAQAAAARIGARSQTCEKAQR